MDIIRVLYNKWFAIDPNRTLQKHFVFWLPILIFVGWGLVLLFPLLGGRWPQPSEYGLVLNQIQYPIFVMSIAIPLTVMVGRFHATSQRKVSNDLTKANQTFTHYYEHKRFFSEDLIARFDVEDSGYSVSNISNPSTFYKIAFPTNSRENMDYRHEVEPSALLIVDRLTKAYRAADNRLLNFEDSWVFHPDLEEDASAVAEFGESTKRMHLLCPPKYQDMSMSIVENFMTQLGLKPRSDFHERFRNLPKHLTIFMAIVADFQKAIEVALTFDDEYADEHKEDAIQHLLRVNLEIRATVKKYASIITQELKADLPD